MCQVGSPSQCVERYSCTPALVFEPTNPTGCQQANVKIWGYSDTSNRDATNVQVNIISGDCEGDPAPYDDHHELLSIEGRQVRRWKFHIGEWYQIYERLPAGNFVFRFTKDHLPGAPYSNIGASMK